MTLTPEQVEEFAADPLLTPYTRKANVALIHRIAVAAAKGERERCADIADQHNSIEGIAQKIAAAIRSTEAAGKGEGE